MHLNMCLESPHILVEHMLACVLLLIARFQFSSTRATISVHAYASINQ